ncbi:MAG: phage holin family protein [Jannaschia sp.]
MSNPNDPPRSDQRNIGTLAGDVLERGSNLIRKEAQLAQAEMLQKLSQMRDAIAMIIAGAVTVAVSLGILLAALVSGVARLLVGLFAEEPVEQAVAIQGLDESGNAIVTAMNDNFVAALETTRALPAYEGLAALIVGIIFAIVGALLMRSGLNKLDLGNLAPERTIRQVKEDGELVRDHT